MGYLDKSTITVDAILTNRGRELLSQGTGPSGFQITKFAVADDEVDYRLYNTAHPLGSNYYGAIIENMPVLEATPDETQTMRYKLVTVTGADLSPNVIIPQLTITPPIAVNGTVSLYFDATKGATSIMITPSTTYTAGNTSAESSYTLLLADSSTATVEVKTPATGIITPNARGSITATGKTFELQAKNITRSTPVTIFGNTSGAVFTFTLSVTA